MFCLLCYVLLLSFNTKLEKAAGCTRDVVYLAEDTSYYSCYHYLSRHDGRDAARERRLSLLLLLLLLLFSPSQGLLDALVGAKHPDKVLEAGETSGGRLCS